MNIRKEFDTIAQQRKPRIVLHHPHTTDSDRIWVAAINDLMSRVPSVGQFISAGRYFNDEGERADLDDVLHATRKGDTLDFIVKT